MRNSVEKTLCWESNHFLDIYKNTEFYRIQKFITTQTKACYWSLSWVTHTLLPSFPRFILIFFHLHPGLPSDLAAAGFLRKTSHIHLHCPVYNVCFDHVILPNRWDHVLKIVNGLTGQRSLFTISYMFLIENIKHPLEYEGERRKKKITTTNTVVVVLVVIAIVTTVFVKYGEVNPMHHEGKHKRESGGTVQLILNLSSVWRWMVTCMPWKLYPPQIKSPVLTAQGTGWAPEPGTMLWRREKYLVLRSNQITVP